MGIPFFHTEILSVRDTILQLLDQELDHDTYFVVGVHSDSGERNIQVLLDGREGVDIGYCARLSRRISRLLDEQDMGEQGFRFEISSPGADKPLVDPRQYPKHIGRELEVLLDNDEKLTGSLHSVTNDELVLKIVTDPKKKGTEMRSVSFDNIQHSTVIISFKSLRK